MSDKFTSTIAGAAILITGVGLLSKGFGFLREVIYANNFGLQTNYDLYLVGAVLPITLNTSIVYLAQNYFIPHYHKKHASGRDIAERFLSSSFWFFTFCTALLAGFLYAVAPSIIKPYLGVDDPHVLNLVSDVFQIFIFSIPLNAGFAILAAYFQAEFNFKSPALSTLLQNTIIILLVIGFSNKLNVLAIPIGYLLGTAAQLFYLFSKLKIKKQLFLSLFEFNFDILKIVDKSLVFIIVIEIINQLYILVDRYFYGSVDAGGIAALNYAMVIYMLPISILSLALSTAIFPKLSQTLSMQSSQIAEDRYLLGLKLNVFFIIPITFIFILIGDSIIGIFYQRGSFTPNDTLLTYDILKFYSISMMFYSSYAIINKVVFGAGFVKQLFVISIFVFLLKIIFNFILVDIYKQNGLAISTTLCYAALSTSAYVLVLKKLEFRITKQLVLDIIFYLLNAMIAYIVLITILEIVNLSNFLRLIFSLIIFFAVYIGNISALKTRDFLILKESLVKYF
jgi:putative peptidoglycan lipid II flippase